MDLEYGSNLKYIYCFLNESKSEIFNLKLTRPNNEDNNVGKIEEKLNEGLDSVIELKLFSNILDKLLGNRTKSILQLNRLREENVWLKEELKSIQEKMNQCDHDIFVKDNSTLKSKFIYQMKAIEFNRSEKKENLTTNFEMSEIENGINETIEGENLTNENISKRIKNLLTVIKDYSQKGQFEIAITVCKHAVESMKQNKNQQSDMAIMLCMLGFLYKDVHKWEEASNSINEALHIRESIYGFESSVVASTLNNLAIIQAGSSKFQEAEQLCRRALKIRLKLFDPNHESVAKQMNNLGLLLINMGSFEEGDYFFQKALTIYSKLENTELFYLKTSTNLANLYMKKVETDKAESHLIKNLKTIYRYRFSCESENILSLYTVESFNNDAKVLLPDKFIVPEIVNLKFLIKLYNNNQQNDDSNELRNCLKLLLPLSNDDDELDLSMN